MLTYAGIIIECNGINIAPTIPRKKYGVPLKVNFARPNPAKVLKIKIIEIAPKQTRIELKSCLPIGITIKSFSQEIRECPGAPKNCSLDLKDCSIIKVNG
jgi:hypothetical protein